MAVGAGQAGQRANGVLGVSGNRVGEIYGHTGNALTCFCTPEPYTLVSAGEGNEILKHPGVPFKGQGDSITNHHEA